MAGTEKSFSGEFWDSKEVGIYKSIASGEIIFSCTDKYYSSSGWPTFSRPAKVMPGKKSCIVEVPDNTNFPPRIILPHGPIHDDYFSDSESEDESQPEFTLKPLDHVYTNILSLDY